MENPPKRRETGAPRLPSVETPKSLSIPSKSRKAIRTEQSIQKDREGPEFDRIVERTSRAQKEKQKLEE
jgi:hypothetical protein